MRTASALSVTRRLSTLVAALWLLADGVSGPLLAQRQTGASGFRLIHVRVFDGLRTLQDTEVAVEGDDARARRAMLLDLCRIAPPQPDLVALQGKIARGRKRAIAAADIHNFSALRKIVRGDNRRSFDARLVTAAG